MVQSCAVEELVLRAVSARHTWELDVVDWAVLVRVLEWLVVVEDVVSMLLGSVVRRRSRSLAIDVREMEMKWCSGPLCAKRRACFRVKAAICFPESASRPDRSDESNEELENPSYPWNPRCFLLRQVQRKKEFLLIDHNHHRPKMNQYSSRLCPWFSCEECIWCTTRDGRLRIHDADETNKSEGKGVAARNLPRPSLFSVIYAHTGKMKNSASIGTRKRKSTEKRNCW